MAKKKRRSRITNPNDGAIKTVMHVFRTDEELADILEGVGNKSKFILRAVRKEVERTKSIICSKCKGKGRVIIKRKKRKIIKKKVTKKRKVVKKKRRSR